MIKLIIYNFNKSKYLYLAIFSTLISKLILFISNIIYSRGTNQDNYGKYSFFITNVVIISEFLTLGFNNTIIQYVASKDDISRSDFYKSTLTLVCLIFSIVVICNYFLKINTFFLENYLPVFFILIINIITSYLNGIKDYKKLIGLNFIFSLFFLLSSMISLNQKIEINKIFTLLFLMLNILVVVFYVFKNKSIKLLQFNFFKYYKKYISYTLPAFLSTIFVSPVLILLYNSIVEKIGYGEFAVISIANQFKSIVLISPIIISKFLLSYLSSTIGNKIKFLFLLKLNFVVNLTITVLLSTIVILFADEFLLIFGVKEDYDKRVLFIIVLSTIPTALNDIVGQAIASRDSYWYGLLLNFLWAIILLFSFYFIFNKNAIGFAYSILISYTIMLIFSMYFTYKKILN